MPSRKPPPRSRRTRTTARPTQPALRSAAAGGTLRDQARGIYRDAIFDATAEVLAERGFAKTRMQDVAARAGLSTGSLYNYFTSKVELTISLLEHRAQQAATTVAAIVADPTAGGSIVERLVTACLRHLDQHRALLTLMDDSGPERGEIGPEAARCDRMKHIYLGAIRSALEVATERGELRRGPSLDDVAILLGGMFHNFARHAMATGSTTPLVDRAPLVIDFFLNGVGRRTR